MKKPTPNPEKTARIRQELSQAGVTPHGLNKAESKYLPNIIHDTEHIKGAVYGTQPGTFSAMLVATDRRVIFLDKKPLYCVSDELTYDVISGIKQESTALGANITLYTRVGDYSLHFVNPVCAGKFQKAVEKLQLEASRNSNGNDNISFSAPSEPLPEKARNFLREHELGVLSTINRTGEVTGAAVYYVMDENDNIYVLTKFGTAKVQNVLTHHQVALTIYDEAGMETTQIKGNCEIETNSVQRKMVYDRIMHLRSYKHGQDLPPVSKVDQPAYVVLKIHPISSKYLNFSKP